MILEGQENSSTHYEKLDIIKQWLLFGQPIENPQITQDIDKAIGCSPQTDSNAPLVKIILSATGNMELMPT